MSMKRRREKMLLSSSRSAITFLLCMISNISSNTAEARLNGISFQGQHQEEHFSFSSAESNSIKCFETTEELRGAVRRYKSYHDIDTDLMEMYGWPIDNWCVSHIEDFSSLFFRKRHFNEPLNSWDMSNSKDTSAMFMDCFEFNQPLDHWNVKGVTNMNRMFAQTRKFNQPLGSWNLASLNDASFMFMHAIAFDQDLSSWESSLQHIEHLEGAFEDTRSLHYRKLRGYDSHLENVRKQRGETKNMFTYIDEDELTETDEHHVNGTISAGAPPSAEFADCRLRA